jgi:uncharacterized membrane protein HdeD (DUF308 family)
MQKIIIKSYDTKKTLIMPILMLLSGILLFTNPGGIIKIFSYILGGIFISLASLKYISDYKRNDVTTTDTFYTISMLLIGIIFILFSGLFDMIVRVIIGIWIIINGLNTIAKGSNLMSVNKKSILSLLIGVLLVIIGLYMILVNNLVFSTIGLLLIIYSILEIINYFYVLVKER